MNTLTNSRDGRLDTLRGFLSFLMAGVLVPTPLSRLLQEPFGFTSAAEGFVLLGAFLAGSADGKICRQSGWATMAGKVWERAKRIYFMAATTFIGLFDVSKALQTAVSLLVIAALFPWAAWLERRCRRRAKATAAAFIGVTPAAPAPSAATPAANPGLALAG